MPISAEPPPDDLPEAIRRADAAERARQAALAPPQRPRRASNQSALGSWLETMVSGLVDDVRAQTTGTRETTVNNAALRVGTYVHLGVDRAHAERELFAASEHNGWVGEQGASHVEWKIRRAIDDGMKKPAERPDLDAETTKRIDPGKGNPQPGKISAEEPPPKKQSAREKNDGADPEDVKTLKMRRLSTIKTRVPTWVWEYNGKGRIQLGTLTMFAGKPAAGKSTAARWFAARLSRGELPGIWFGHPMKVAVIMSEEQTDAIVVPGLVAANADLQNIYTPEIKYGNVESGFSTEDMGQLQEELLDMQVRALFVDPVMSTFGGKADIYRNNEVREKLAPFTRMAQAVNGIVIGVTHLKKGEIRDVLGGMNGSSAFGEVPRAVFGFAPINDTEHVMQQVKNSAGQMGLKLAYHLPIEFLTADDGLPIDLPRFEITGETDVGIEDIADETETTKLDVAIDWLRMYLLENQPAPSGQVKKDAHNNGDIKERTLFRASQRLGVIIRSVRGAKVHQTVWELPDED